VCRSQTVICRDNRDAEGFYDPKAQSVFDVGVTEQVATTVDEEQGAIGSRRNGLVDLALRFPVVNPANLDSLVALEAAPQL
jgi:hypothetical protein